MKDNEQDLIFEAYLQGKDPSDKSTSTKQKKKPGEFNIANTKPGTRGSVKSPWQPSSFAKGTDHWKQNEKDKPKEEAAGGGFSGQGTPEQASWLGSDTHDGVTEDDIDGKLREIESQVNTLHTWLTDVATASELVDDLGGRDESDVWDDLSKLQQTINGFIGEYKVESVNSDPMDERDDDYTGEDLPPRETDQDRYGYPGDR